ncbi:Ferredoxin--NAD(+) reductase [Rhizobium sp. CF080]|uniref:NAD(P)/FAD-dependent oxidoreductase n=1 Tax=Rhizobium sp. (strain CF080) TaxID=1144310 RepID=UPI0002719A95|nr:FAD-dependent oxidoreductase [Rhizobium sp. CF080]EUB99428.1 Ferredoxin--NAD(+) reductase [Rhizobium sp. CF080]
MQSDRETVVIVGAGQAGAWVAITLRSLDPERRIVLIGDEAHPPYERPPLSKAILAGKAGIESAYIKPETFYADNRIELMLNRRVRHINRDRNSLTLDDGSNLDYGTLVLATGCRPRPLPVKGADLPQVHTLRTIADVEKIATWLKPGSQVVAIGAGFIGLEFAAVAIEAGCGVTIVDAAPHAMGRVIDKSVAETIAAGHSARGVDFRFSAAIDKIEAEGEQAVVVLGSGERLPADLVIVGIGAIPNSDLAEAAHLACDDGIIVNAFGRTDDPKIFAVGDVTRHFNPLLGRSLRLESWQNAQNQGIAVAKAIAGTATPYADLPWFWSDQYDTNLQIIGAPTTWDRIIWRGERESGKFTAIYMHGEKVVAGNSMNNPRDIRFIKQLILNGTPVPDAALADPATSLAQLAKG